MMGKNLVIHPLKNSILNNVASLQTLQRGCKKIKMIPYVTNERVDLSCGTTTGSVGGRQVAGPVSYSLVPLLIREMRCEMSLERLAPSPTFVLAIVLHVKDVGFGDLALPSETVRCWRGPPRARSDTRELCVSASGAVRCWGTGKDSLRLPSPWGLIYSAACQTR